MDYYFHKFFGIQKVLEKIKFSKFSKILELGCGVGLTTKFIVEKFSESQITALDYDKEQIKTAREKNNNNRVDFIAGDATKLDFPDNFFDMVFEILTFHHIPNYEKAMKEVFRVLKSNGKFIVLDIPMKSLNPFHYFFFFQPAEFTRKEFIKFLEDAGFSITKNKGGLMFSIEAVKSEKI